MMPEEDNNENLYTPTSVSLSKGYLDGLQKFKEQESNFVTRMGELALIKKAQLDKQALKIINSKDDIKVQDVVLNYIAERSLDQVTDTHPKHIYFSNGGDGTGMTELDSSLSAHLQLVWCTSWKELDLAIENNPHQLVLNFQQNTVTSNVCMLRVLSMIQTRLQVSGIDIPIAICLTKNTTARDVRAWKKAGVFGIVPYHIDFGYPKTIEAITALTNRQPYWPKDIIDQLPGSVNKSKKNAGINTGNEIILTARQLEVQNLVCNRGLSNKQIANSLHIVESTVKIHLSAIMKAHGVRNRTQLVLATKNQLRA